MNKLEQLAREATDLGRRNAASGNIVVSARSIGGWEIDVYVYNEFAFGKCDRVLGDFGVITEQGDNLDTVIDQALARVQDAVAGTPAEQVA